MKSDRNGMNRIFIEANRAKTPECCFLETIMKSEFSDKSYEFICMDGVANLFNQANLNKIKIAAVEGDNVIVILDADTQDKKWGFAARKADVEGKMHEHGVDFPLFLYPNNHDDGDFETLLESLARKDLHQEWWDCFSDYEICVSGVCDEHGNPKYEIPNRKAKLHTFISSQHLSNSARKKTGSGRWLFDDSNYWDLTRDSLRPLLDFLRNNLQ